MQTSINAAALCRLVGASPAADEQEAGMLRFALRRVPAGEVLLRQGGAMRNVYVVRSGFFKSAYVRSTMEHVTAFSMTGDTVGLESIGADVHAVDVVALTDAEVAIVPYTLLQQADSGQRFFTRLLLKLLCSENEHKSRLVALLGYPNALARVAAFLIAQGQAFAKLGYSHKSFILPMRNSDVGSYLGLRAETVCRSVAALKSAGYIDVELRCYVLKDEAGLREIVDGDRSPVLDRQAVRRPVRRARIAPQAAAWAET